jgi:hypothetical protein
VEYGGWGFVGLVLGLIGCFDGSFLFLVFIGGLWRLQELLGCLFIVLILFFGGNFVGLFGD